MAGSAPIASAALPAGELAEEELTEITSRVAGLGLAGWIDELRRLRQLSEDRGLGWHAEDARLMTLEVAGRKRSYLRSAQITLLIEPGASTLTLPEHLLPALVVNISAPNHLVLAHFHRALEEARQRHPQPFNRPGLAKQAAPLDWKRLRASWIDHHIVELAELLARQKRAPKWRLGARLGLDRNKTLAAEKKLRAAIGHLPSLAAQLRHGEPLEGAGVDRALGADGRKMLITQAVEWEASGDLAMRAEGAKIRMIVEDG